MTVAIEKRYNKIRQGMVPEGYRETKAGILPSNWTSAPLSLLAEEITETPGSSIIETVSISAGVGFVNQAKKFGRELSGKQYEKYIVLHRGDFSYNKGNSSTYPQGCIYRLKDREKAAVPSVFESFRIQNGNAGYYEQVFVSGFLNHQLYSKINHGVRDNGLLNLTGEDFFRCEVPVPPIKEQEHIAEILTHCDKVIALYQQQLDEIKKQKKYFLQNLFPPQGAKNPKIRFPNCTSPWEQCKLLDCIEKVTDFRGRTPKKLGMDWSERGCLALSALNVKDGYIDFTQDVHYGSQELYDKWMTGNELHKGQVLFTTEAPMGNVAQVPDNRRYILSQRTIAFDVKPDLITENFLATVLRSPAVFSALTALSSGGTAKGVSQKSLSTVYITIPSDLEEQEQLANTFLELDNLINLHQKKLDEAQREKKALMQLLLTGIVRVNT